jgi:hypothetical protein
MTTRATTASGAVYEYDGDTHRIRRFESESGNAKRRDGDWLRLDSAFDPQIGQRLVLELEPLDARATSTTVRITTPVTEIRDA